MSIQGFSLSCDGVGRSSLVTGELSCSSLPSSLSWMLIPPLFIFSISCFEKSFASADSCSSLSKSEGASFNSFLLYEEVNLFDGVQIKLLVITSFLVYSGDPSGENSSSASSLLDLRSIFFFIPCRFL